MNGCQDGPQDSKGFVEMKPVYRPKGRNFPILCVYFYYLTPSEDGHPDVQAFRHIVTSDIPDASMPGLIEDLTKKARAGTITSRGDSVGSILWQRRSYIAVVLDDRNDNLLKGNAMEFVDGEHTFRNGKDIILSNVDNLSAFYCTNHMKRKHASDPDLEEGDHEEFDVCIHLVSEGPDPVCPVPDDGGPGGHNESGTNTGPPLS
jgi:hypothetical protein